MKRKVQVIDAEYTITDEQPEIQLYCKTPEGENVLAVDTQFRPYFYAIPVNDVEELSEKIQEMRFEDNDGEELPVTEIKRVEKLEGHREVKALKIYTTVPPNVPKIEKEVYEMPETSECREYDIPFYKRYLIDNEIRPAKTIQIEGEETEKEQFDETLEVKSVEEAEDEKIDFEELAFDLEVYEDEIIMASMASENYTKLLTTEEIDRQSVKAVENEKQLLERFIEIVQERDVDVLTGYNTDEYDFQKLRERCEKHGMELSLGRDGERMKFKRRGRFSGARLKGRMHLDLYPFIEHILAPGINSETLDLDSVAQEMLGREKDDMSWEEMKKAWEEKEKLEEFADYALKDAKLAHELAQEIIPQMLELSMITGMIPFDTCRLTYGQLTENYLLREAYKRNMISPNRPTRSDRRKRQNQGAYSGGFVYEPESGLHENIAVMDFRSLYPTVMVAHNISPDTLDIGDCQEKFEMDEFNYSFCQDFQGFFPELVENLVEERYQLKSKLDDYEEGSKEYNSIYNRQEAEKILANSFYGYLGYHGARWYSRESAEATTYLGRDYIQKTIEKAEGQGYEVAYGDSLDYSRQIVVRNPEGTVEFLEIGEFVEDVENPGDYETVAWDSDKEKAVFRPVKKAISHEYDGKLLKFDTNRGRTKVTPQHSVYRYENGIELADASELEEGDHLVSLSEPPKTETKYSEGDTLDLAELDYNNSDLRAYKDLKKFPAERGKCPYCKKEFHLSSHVHAQHPERKVTLEGVTSEYSYIGCENAKAGKIPRYWDISTEFAWILGFYCGDGSASTGNKQMISFGGQDKENIDKVKSFFDDILDDELALIEDVDSRTGNKMYYYRVQRRPLVSFFVEGIGAGIGSSKKRVPNIILNGDEDLKQSFIHGYFEADGSKERGHDSRYNSESIRSSTESSYLANQLQYILKQLNIGENRYGREINDVSYKYRKDKPEIKSIRNTAAREPKFSEINFTPAPINNIEKVKPTKNKVYDLQVEGEHNFVDAEGMMLVHNTDSVFLKKDNIKHDIDEFVDDVNDDLPKFMELEFEGFFARGFFTSTDSGEGAKKKYALLSEDGSMKITGFEQVRRDWSPIAKETQKRVLEKVLNEDIEKAAELVKDVIERLKNGRVPPEELRIYTTLTKPPEEYDSTAPHVEAVKKAKDRGNNIEAETTISYVITRGSGNISSRAELTKYAEDYDADYYIENQIIPVSLRVLKVFGYTDGQLQGKGRQSGLGRFN